MSAADKIGDSIEVAIHHFASSVIKVTKEGDTVISNYIEKGEKLINGITFEEVLQGILVKEPEVKTSKHQTTTEMTTDETKTNTVVGETDKDPEDEKSKQPSATTDDVPSQGDSGPAKTADDSASEGQATA